MIKDLALPGDILLYRVTTQSPLRDRLIAASEVLFKEISDSAVYYHVSLVNQSTQYEAVIPKTRESWIDWALIDLELWRVKDVTTVQTSLALQWAKSHLGSWYSISPYVFGLVHFKNTYTCSEWVRAAYLNAQIDLSEDKDKIFSPDDIVTNKIIRIA